ncbi:MAG: hypothetical protein WD825_14915 [Gemmatimonadaceae bacterium]
MQLKTAVLGLALFSMACASGSVQQSGVPEPSKRAIADIPDWVLNPPKDSPTHSYSSGQGESRDMSIAVNTAEADARNKSAQTLQTELKSLEDKFQSSVRGDAGGEEVLNTFRQAVRTVTNQTLTGSRVAQRKVTADPSGTSYRVFILMELDKGAAKTALMDKVKADANLYARFRASQAFTDLDAEIKKIEDAKKAGTPSTPPNR